jgi:hypothetical protein
MKNNKVITKICNQEIGMWISGAISWYKNLLRQKVGESNGLLAAIKRGRQLGKRV